MQDLVTFTGDRLAIRFDSFGLDRYDLFLRAKKLPEMDIEVDDDLHYTLTAPARFAPLLGVEAPRRAVEALTLAPHLYEDQGIVTRNFLDAKRYAVWCDCGWGKTPVALECARQVIHLTGGRVLITTLNEIVPQWLDETRKFYGDSLPMVRLETRDALRHWCRYGGGGSNLAITNYEKWNPESVDRQVVSEAKYLAGHFLDEGSRLRTGGGKQKWAIIKSSRGIEFKLILTATPAPNEIMEFASQAAYLEKMRSEGEIIWTYFRRDPKTHRWTVKQHAKEAFFRFMSSWSIYIRDPRRYGWRLDMVEVPRPTVEVHTLPLTEEQRRLLPVVLSGDEEQPVLFGGDGPGEFNAIQGAKVSQLAKGFRYRTVAGKRKTEPVASVKPAFVADLVAAEAARGEGAVLVWTVFDAEAEILSALLKGRVPHDCLTGKTSAKKRLQILDRFRAGDLPVLVSRAKVLGFGMNLQVVGSMIFSGWTYGYEDYYQALRRAYRQGQTRSLRVHIPAIPQLEGDMLDTIWRKQDEHEAAIAEMEKCYIEIRNQNQKEAFLAR